MVKQAGAAIETQDLTKVYPVKTGTHTAVDKVSLRVEHGEFFGLLGSNGAGKSTIIGMLTGLITPTSGRMRVAGFDVRHRPVAVKQVISVVPQRNSLDQEITIAENLQQHGRMFGLGPRAARRRAAHLLDECGIADLAERTITTVSGGQARRATIARALMHQPEVLFLDEPTAGVDLTARQRVWTVLRKIHAAGTTIVLTTHYLEEAQTLCGRVAVLNRGTIKAVGPTEVLRAQAGLQTILTIQLDADAGAVAAAAADIATVTRVEHHGDTLKLHTTQPEGLISEIVFLAESERRYVKNATTTTPTLNSVFLALTKNTTSATAAK